MVALEVVLDEDAAEFVVAVVDVVGPLDVDVIGLAAQQLTQHYGDILTEDELA